MQDLLLPALRSALTSASLLHPGATLLAAVSGGGDSVALLYALGLLRGEIGLRLVALHVDHGLRGPASQEDAAFVQSLCQGMGVPLLLRHARLSGSMESPGMEEKARQARRALYLQAMEETGAEAVLLAHHQGDQGETVLMRLIRVAGAQGLGGMRASLPFGGGLLLRPFLDLPQAALRSALLRAGGRFREDESNALGCCLRNRLRLEVMPLLEACQSQAAAHMAQAAQRLQWDEDFLQALAVERLGGALAAMPACHALSLEALGQAPPALLTRALRLWVARGLALIQPSGAPGERSLSHGDTLALLTLAQGGGSASLNLPWGLRAVRSGGYLHLLPQEKASLLPLPQIPPLPLCRKRQEYALASHFFRLRPWAGERPPAPRELLLPPALLEEGLCLRFPQPGDRIHPLGAPGAKPLRRMLTDRKVPAPFRGVWPVLAQGSQVYWVPQVALGQEVRLPQAPEGLLCLGLESPLPPLP